MNQRLQNCRTFAAAASIEDVILSDSTDDAFTQELSPDKTILIIENTGDDFESFTITFVLESSEEIKYIFFEESNYIVISDYLTEAEIALLQTINVTRQSNKKITIEDASSYIKINLSTNAVNYSLIATVINAHTQESESITVTSDALGSIEDFARIVDKLTLSLQVIDSSILDIQKFECYEVIFTNDEGEEVTLEYTSRNLDILISELVINNTISELSIYAKFENSYQLALEEQETNKDGTIDIVESTEVLNKVTVNIATDQNKYISNIELAIVNDDNTVGEYISIMNGFDVDDTLLNLNKIYGSIVERVYTSADSNGKVLLN